MLWTAFITPVVHQSSRYGLEPIVWLQQWALILIEYKFRTTVLLTGLIIALMTVAHNF